MKYLFICFFAFLHLNLNCQIIGGIAYEKAYIMNSDGNSILYMAGFTASYGAGNRDAFIVKYNTISDQIMMQTWGKTDYDEIRDLKISDDYIYCSGFSMWRDEKSLQAILLKMDKNLNLIWVKNYGNWHFQHSYSTLILSDKTILVGGVDRSIGTYGPYLIRVSPDGTTIFEKTYSDYTPVHIVSMIEENDEKILLVCNKGGFFNLGTNWHSAFHQNANVLFIEIDKYGNVIRTKEITTSGHDIPVKIKKFNNNYYLLGHSQSFSSQKSFDIFLASLDISNLDFNWIKTYGDTNYEYAADLIFDNDYIHIVGSSGNKDTNITNLYYLKTDLQGDKIDEQIILENYKIYGVSI